MDGPPSPPRGSIQSCRLSWQEHYLHPTRWRLGQTKLRYKRRQSHFLVSETLQPIKAQYNQYQRLFKRWNNRNVIASSPIPLNSNSFSKGYFLPSRFVLLLLLRFFSCSSFASFVRVQSCYKILYILFKFPTTPKCTLSSNEIRRWRCCNCWLSILKIFSCYD